MSDTAPTRNRGRAAWVIVAFLLVVVGLLISVWVWMWGFDPWTLEGAWIYPLAAGTLALAALATGRVNRKLGWLIAALTLGYYASVMVWWAFTHGFPPGTLAGWSLYALGAVMFVGAVTTARRIRAS